MAFIQKILVNTVLCLSNYRVVNFILFKIQNKIAEIAVIRTNEISFVKDVFVKGGMSDFKSYRAGLSDIDLIIIANDWKSYEELERYYHEVEKKLKKVKRFFPAIDIDICSTKTFNAKIVLYKFDNLLIDHNYNSFDRNIISKSQFVIIYQTFRHYYFYAATLAKNIYDNKKKPSYYKRERIKRSKTKLEKIIFDISRLLFGYENNSNALKKNILNNLHSFNIPMYFENYLYDGNLLYLVSLPVYCFKLVGENYRYKINCSKVTVDLPIIEIDLETLLIFLKLGILTDAPIEYNQTNDYINSFLIEIVNQLSLLRRQQIRIQNKFKDYTIYEGTSYLDFSFTNRIELIKLRNEMSPALKPVMIFTLEFPEVDDVVAFNTQISSFANMFEYEIMLVVITTDVMKDKLVNLFENYNVFWIRDNGNFSIKQQSNLYNLTGFYHLFTQSYCFVDLKKELNKDERNQVNIPGVIFDKNKGYDIGIFPIDELGLFLSRGSLLLAFDDLKFSHDFSVLKIISSDLNYFYPYSSISDTSHYFFEKNNLQISYSLLVSLPAKFSSGISKALDIEEIGNSLVIYFDIFSDKLTSIVMVLGDPHDNYKSISNEYIIYLRPGRHTYGLLIKRPSKNHFHLSVGLAGEIKHTLNIFNIAIAQSEAG